MEKQFAYAFSEGEGTLLQYGVATMHEIMVYHRVRFVEATFIVGPADGTGE